MSSIGGLTARRITIFKGAQVLSAGPCAIYQIKVDRVAPTPGALREALTRVRTDFPEAFTHLHLPQSWFTQACEGGSPEDLAACLVALVSALQWGAMDPVGPGRVVRRAAEGPVLVANYLRSTVLFKAVGLALRLLDMLCQGPVDDVQLGALRAEICVWWQTAGRGGCHPEAFRLALVARSRGVPMHVVDGGLVTLGWGRGLRRLSSLFADTVSAPVSSRYLQGNSLAAAGVPVPVATLVVERGVLPGVAAELGWPILVGPQASASPSRLVRCVSSLNALQEAFDQACSRCPAGVLLERRVEGCEYRFLVVAGHCVSVLRRRPSAVPEPLQAIHPDNLRLAERAAAILGTELAEVLVVAVRLDRSFLEAEAKVCEVLTFPDLSLHRQASPERYLDAEIFDRLYAGHSFRIPTVAITGTNGKTTSCRMVHRILRAAGVVSGLSCTSETVVGDDVVSRDNLSGHPGASVVLRSPNVQAAVLEMPRKGLLTLGQPCDRYDVVALTNLQNDHIGELGVNSMDDLARLKATVLERAARVVVLNADDPRVMAISSRSAVKRRILTSLNADNPVVAAHLAGGGEAVVSCTIDGVRWLVYRRGNAEQRVIALSEIPAAMGGLLTFNEINAQTSIAISVGLGLAVDVIRRGLSMFSNTAECNPGRYNFIEGFPAKVLLDFAHNPEGVAELVRVADSIQVPGHRWLVLTKTANRHREAIAQTVPLIAGKFDHYILSCDAPFVQASAAYDGPDKVGTMLGMLRDALVSSGVDQDKVLVFREPLEAMTEAVRSAVAGDLVVITGECWDALVHLRQLGVASSQRGSSEG